MQRSSLDLYDRGRRRWTTSAGASCGGGGAESSYYGLEDVSDEGVSDTFSSHRRRSRFSP